MKNDLTIVGAGPAGLMAALSVAKMASKNSALERLKIGCVGPLPRLVTQAKAFPDTRTTALFEGSVQLLKNLEIWPDLIPFAAPLKEIRIIDDSRRLLRAPEITFQASEIGLEAFGYNIANMDLVPLLLKKAGGIENLDLIATENVAKIDHRENHIELTLADGERLLTRYVVGADGRRSICRESAAIEVRHWHYPQMALACNFDHEKPHGDISIEFHRAPGPFTVVPLKGHCSSLVWVENRQEAERLKTLNDLDFSDEMERRLQGHLGSIITIGRRSAFPLSGLTATRFAQQKIALVGESAHVMPPIGAQGLNLGFRDAAALADCIEKAAMTHGEAWPSPLSELYHQARRSDVWSRVAAVDLLNRSLISPLFPVQLVRGLGLYLLKTFSPLRRATMRRGLQPETGLPNLMKADFSAARHLNAR